MSGTWTWGAVIVALVAAGCCPSRSTVIEMRSPVALTQEKAPKNFARVMKYFGEEPRDACWRAEAMTTLRAIDENFDYPTNAPQKHADLAEALKRECRTPNLEKKEAGDAATVNQVKAWAAYTLGKFSDPDIAPFMLGLLDDNTNAQDPAFTVRLVALDVLAPRTSYIVAQRGLRNRLLCLLPPLESGLGRSDADSGTVAAARKLIRHFEAKVRSYAAVVDLLPPRNSTNLKDDMLLVALKWNYQKLGIGDHLKPENAKAFEENVGKALDLAWDRRPVVREKARLVLADYAPHALFARLATVIAEKNDVLAEDYVLLATLVPITDRAESKPADYARCREAAFEQLFAAISQVPQEHREVIYARLLAHDPKLLRKHLLAVTPLVLEEDHENASQHIRYLGQLLKLPAAGEDAVARERIAAAIASFVSRESVMMREQIRAHLVGEHFVILGAKCTLPLKGLGNEKIECADCLVETYLACLTQVEKQGKGPNTYTKEMIDRFGGHPYNPLEHGIMRPEMPTKKRILAFLATRDSSLVVTFMSNCMERNLRARQSVSAEEFAMLGDTMQATRPQLSKAASEAGVKTLRQGIASADEETALMCSRYLIELGEQVPAEVIAKLPVSCRTMFALAFVKAGDAASSVKEGGAHGTK